MGLLNYLRRIFGSKSQEKATQSAIEPDSISDSIDSIVSDRRFSNDSIDKPSDSIDSIASTTKPVDSLFPQKPKEKYDFRASEKLYVSQQSSQPLQTPKEPVLEKDSFQLGLAAGYTGKSIKEIEHSLNRIENQMVTREWFKTEFQDDTPRLVQMMESIRNILEHHDSGTAKRFEAIQSLLERMQGTALKAPEPIKTELLREIEVVKSHIPLSPKMAELVATVRTEGEMSYSTLSYKLGITTSALRGLLSNTLKRTDNIERFKRDGKGWVRYKPS